MAGLYAIVDAGFLRARGVAVREFAEGLRAAGVPVVQWRCKDGAPAEVLAGARTLREVFAGTGTLLVMNDRVDLALLAGFDGVHVGGGAGGGGGGRGCGEKAPTRGGGEQGLVVGVSTHTVDQVAGAGDADYVAVGPVFGTSTKLDAEAVVGLEGVRHARGETEKPLVAIGGITLPNCASVREAGADMCAVISGLLVEGRTVESVAREFMERLG